MARTLGVVMDPIRSIKPRKDTTLALLLAAQRHGYQLRYLELGDLRLRDGVAIGNARELRVFDDEKHWFELGEAKDVELGALDVMLMRVDPPFDLEYISATYILERAEAAGCRVVNKPASLRDCNEKMFTAYFPQCAPPTLFTRNAESLREFHREHGDIILKPVDGMGGSGIFRVRPDGMNLGAIIEELTERGRRTITAQRYLPEITAGDKRVLVVNGEPLPYTLARIPKDGETRGNLAAGGRGEVRPITDRELWIAAQVAPELIRRGLLLAGLDVIGDYLTEINVTSPTCAREIAYETGVDAAELLIAALN